MAKTAPSHFAHRHNWRRTVFIALFVAINIVAIVATAASEFGNSANAADRARLDNEL